MKFDAKDRRLLYELEQGCRQPFGALGRRVGLSKQALHYRTGRLLREGAILSFCTVVDFARLGYSNYEVFLQLEPIGEKKRKEFLVYLCSQTNVRLVAELGGKYDVLLAILARSVTEFEQFFKDALVKFTSVVRNYSYSISTSFSTFSRTYLADIGGAKKPFILSSGKDAAIDELDKQILSHLSIGARTPTMEIARKCKINVNTARARIRRMEKEGIILGYKAQINHVALGFQNYEILANLQKIGEGTDKKLASFCEHSPYSTFLIKCVGKWDIDLGFDVQSPAHFQKILSEFRSSLAGELGEYDFVSILSYSKFTYFPF